MNKNILLISVSVAIFFMLLSFVLRGIFFTDYVTLFKQPLFVFIGWFIFIIVVLFFLKNDFPEIYKLLVFFEKKSDSQTNKGANNKFEVIDDDDEDYSEIYQDSTSFKNNEDNKENSLHLSDMGLSHQNLDDLNRESMEKSFHREDPKKLANVVKKFLKE